MGIFRNKPKKTEPEIVSVADMKAELQQGLSYISDSLYKEENRKYEAEQAAEGWSKRIKKVDKLISKAPEEEAVQALQTLREQAEVLRQKELLTIERSTETIRSLEERRDEIEDSLNKIELAERRKALNAQIGVASQTITEMQKEVKELESENAEAKKIRELRKMVHTSNALLEITEKR